MTDLKPVIDVTMHNTNVNAMKKIAAIVVLLLFVLGACGPKPYYKTAKGKKKQKYYNDIQFGGKSASEMKKRN